MKKLIMCLAALGFGGAVLFYLPYLHGNVQGGYLLCPACMNVVSVGNPLSKFTRYTLVAGTVNSLFYVAVAYLIRGIICLTRRPSVRP